MKKDVKKEPQNCQKIRKKIDKKFVFAIGICVFIALFVVGTVTIPEPATAAFKLREAKNFIAENTELTVVINSASETVGILNDREAVLKDGEADDFVKRLLFVLKNVEYSDTRNVNIGVWKTKIVLYSPTDEFTLYSDNEGVYIEHKGRLIEYSITDKGQGEYKKLLSDVEEQLNKQ